MLRNAAFHEEKKLNKMIPKHGVMHTVHSVNYAIHIQIVFQFVYEVSQCKN